MTFIEYVVQPTILHVFILLVECRQLDIYIKDGNIQDSCKACGHGETNGKLTKNLCTNWYIFGNVPPKNTESNSKLPIAITEFFATITRQQCS